LTTDDVTSTEMVHVDAVGDAGAANAGILAAEILATGDELLAGRVRTMREGMAAKVLAG